MIGELFSILLQLPLLVTSNELIFRPHDWGAFFNTPTGMWQRKAASLFRPHDWGAFFNVDNNGDIDDSFIVTFSSP